jgi:hypothetical protein
MLRVTVLSLSAVLLFGCARHQQPGPPGSAGSADSAGSRPEGTAQWSGHVLRGDDTAALRRFLETVQEVKATKFKVQWNPATVAVGRDAALRSLRSVSHDGATFVFSSAEPVVRQLREGSILWIRDLALRKVDSVRTTADTTIVHTVVVSLNEAIPNADIEFEAPVPVQNFLLSRAEVTEVAPPAKGAMWRPHRGAGGFVPVVYVMGGPTPMPGSAPPGPPPAPGSSPGNQPGSPSPGSAPGTQSGSPQPGSTPGNQLGSPSPGSAPGTQPRSPQSGSSPGNQPGSPSPGSAPGTQSGSPQPGSTPGNQLGSPSPGSAPGTQPGSPQPGSSPGNQPGSPSPGNAPGTQPGSPDPGSSPGGEGGSPASGSAPNGPGGSGAPGSGTSPGSAGNPTGSPAPGDTPEDQTADNTEEQAFGDNAFNGSLNGMQYSLGYLVGPNDGLHLTLESRADEDGGGGGEGGKGLRHLFSIASDGVDVRFKVQADITGFTTTGAYQIASGNLTGAAMQFKNLNGHVTAAFIGRLGQGGNKGLKIPVMHLPISFNIPLPVEGIPFVVQVGSDFLLTLSLAGNKASLAVNGEYNFNGTSGFTYASGGINDSSSFAGAQPQVTHYDGASLGVSAVVLGVQLPRIGFGLGVTGVASSMAYFDVINVLTMTQSAELGASMLAPRCKRITYNAVGHVGVETKVLLLPIPAVQNWASDKLNGKREIFNQSKQVLDPPIKGCEV